MSRRPLPFSFNISYTYNTMPLDVALNGPTSILGLAKACGDAYLANATRTVIVQRTHACMTLLLIAKGEGMKDLHSLFDVVSRVCPCSVSPYLFREHIGKGQGKTKATRRLLYSERPPSQIGLA